jgi:hypothetical protein
VAQHCWRILGQVIWIGALLSAWAILWLFKNKLDLRHVVIGTFLVMMSANAWFPVSEEADVELADFIKNPRQIYNDDAYLLNFNKNTYFVHKIDNTLVETGNTLKTETPYSIPQPLLQLAVNPSVELHSTLLAALVARDLHLTAFVNNEPVAKQDLNSTELNWSLNLIDAKNHKDTVPLKLKFLLSDKNDNIIHETIPVKKIFLTGFINPAETLNVSEVQKHCETLHNIIHCDVSVASGINFVELPALYYPKLLKISLNGKQVPYQSILFEGKLVAGIVPVAGINNKISIEFRGIGWANMTSLIAWILLGLVVSESLVRRLKRSKKNMTFAKNN